MPFPLCVALTVCFAMILAIQFLGNQPPLSHFQSLSCPSFLAFLPSPPSLINCFHSYSAFVFVVCSTSSAVPSACVPFFDRINDVQGGLIFFYSIVLFCLR